MRIGLLADTHIPEARPALWPQVFDALAGVEMILHAGDVHDFGLLDELERIAPVYAALGDGDDGSGGRPVQGPDARVQPAWTLELGGLLVGLVHALPIPEVIPSYPLEKAIARHFPERAPDVVVYGDSHVESIARIADALYVNPGSPTFPHNFATQLGTMGFLEIVEGRATAFLCRLTDEGVAPLPNGWSPLR